VLAEVTCLANVEIGSNQCPFLLPKHYPFPGKPKSLPVPMMNRHKKQAKVSSKTVNRVSVSF
jgi:hypothetical protein